MDARLPNRVAGAVHGLCDWLNRYGETSYDHQSFYASRIGRASKALYYRSPILGMAAVAPMVCCEAFLPVARRLFWKRERFPIADAHYAMGFAFLAKGDARSPFYARAVHFLEMLEQTRSSGCTGAGWGYPFDWQTRKGVIKAGTPLITTAPYVYEAFAAVHAIDNDPKWLGVGRRIAEHALTDYRHRETGPRAAACGYTPDPEDPADVVNASAYRAFLLTRAARDFSEDRYQDAAEKNLTFVLACQNRDGSWCYSTDGQRTFVDHFHTCFVLKALAKIEQLTGSDRCRRAIERGVDYYIRHLFDQEFLPVPFARAPRLTVYYRELYDYAECINLCVLLAGRFPELNNLQKTVLADLLTRWVKPGGSFRTRKLLIGWDNVPMHRWAQSQMFRSLCFLLSRQSRKNAPGISGCSVNPLESTVRIC